VPELHVPSLAPVACWISLATFSPIPPRRAAAPTFFSTIE